MLLIAVNALVGGTPGPERTVLPLLAEEVLHLDQYTSALTYILAFGLAKCVTNYFAGTLSDRHGRKPKPSIQESKEATGHSTGQQ
jgi:MFS family permease